MLRKRLENGLDIVIKENSFSKMFALQCWIHVGSVDERPGEEGMSHCLEHMLFKGTRNYAVGELSKRIEFLGGDMNAYTSFDHTVFYLTLPSEHAAEAIELLGEAIFHSTFDERELDKEKEVILEEMKRNEDSPSHALGRRIFETVYQGTPAAQPIIGYANNIRSFTRDDVVNFHKRWYRPRNMKLIGVGAVSAAELLSHVEKHFGAEADMPFPDDVPFQVTGPRGVSVHIVSGDYEQSRIEIAFPGPGLLHRDILALDMAAFALGSGESSRLHRKVRDEKKLTSVVGCSLFAPQFGGVFELSAMPHADNYLECLRVLGEELARIRYTQPVTREELDRARANAKADRVYSEETVSGQARSIGNALQTPYETLYDYVVEAQINRLSPYDIKAAVEEWLNPEKAVIACILPQGSKWTENDVRKAFLDGFKAPATRAASHRKADAQGIFVEKLNPQVTVIYREQQHSDLMNLAAVASGGLRVETEKNAGQFHMIADLLGSSTKSLSYEEVLAQVEGQGAVLAGFSGRDSCGLKLQCLTEQSSNLIPLWAESLLAPRFLEEQLENAKLEVFDDIHMEQDSPSNIAMRKFQQAIYGSHPYRNPVYGLKEVVAAWTPASLQKAFEDWRDSSHWIISGVGRLPFEDVLEQLSHVLKPMNRKVDKASNLCQALPQSVETQDFKIHKDREQVHIVIGTLGLHWTDPDRYALDLLSNVLGGSGGHLFLKLRDEQSLAYTVAPLHSTACHRGIFGAYMACSPHKVQEAEVGIRKLWQDICEQGVSKDDLDRARNYLVGSHEADMQRADGQTMTMALMELYGLGYNDFASYTAKLRQVSTADLQRVARRLLLEQKQVTVKVGPFANG